MDLDDLYASAVRRPHRFALILLSAVSGLPFLIGLLLGLALGHWLL